MLDSSYLLISLVFSSIGLGYFIYGRKQKHRVAFYTGICLMGYPYVITDVMPMIILGVALMLVPKFVRL
ncbi:MAG: hypothetical protein O2971_17570 [Proteobacteria bacterium]|nr:hypothetical protein [Pseudomonadota bacterium]